VFGYYIEITKSNLDNVPAEYERKQTLVNAERFTTQELKDYERSVLGAQERCLEIERRIFLELRQTILAASARIRALRKRLPKSICWHVLRSLLRRGAMCVRKSTTQVCSKRWRRVIR